LTYKPVFVVFNVDADGYATVASIQKDRPTGDVLYVKADRFHTNWRGNKLPVDAPKHSYGFNFLFNRYYINEDVGPKADMSYREANRASKNDRDAAMSCENYLVVSILEGEAVAKELYLEGKPVEELVREE
jgi:hypothetical protein